MGEVLPGRQPNVSVLLRGRPGAPSPGNQLSRTGDGVVGTGTIRHPAILGGMREVAGSWLSGPTSGHDGPAQKFKGEKLGLPESGEGSLAPLGVRVGALIVDWLLAYGVVGVVLMLGGTGSVGDEAFSAVASWAVPLVWGVAGVVCVWLFAQTPGQAVSGIGTARVDAVERVGLGRSLVRVIFLFFLLPPLIQDEDGRGLHDRSTGTALIRTR